MKYRYFLLVVAIFSAFSCNTSRYYFRHRIQHPGEKNIEKTIRHTQVTNADTTARILTGAHLQPGEPDTALADRTEEDRHKPGSATIPPLVPQRPTTYAIHPAGLTMSDTCARLAPESTGNDKEGLLLLVILIALLVGLGLLFYFLLGTVGLVLLILFSIAAGVLLILVLLALVL